MKSDDAPPEEPPTLDDRPARDGPDTLVSSERRDGQVVAGTIETEDPTIAAGSTYVFGDVIGSGGGGEVLVAHDKRIGRDIAIKRLRATSPSEAAVALFLREARIQARIDHPSVVPVHEIGRDPQGRPYFTMKRVTGTTMRVLLAGGVTSRQRLLRAFADVCLAVEFAHARGIVHRDLKPANVMLGDFGEVYVLDWGVARIVDDSVAEVVTGDIDSLDSGTPHGDLLGTPGYMAPEQIHSPRTVTRPADVYALGSILFELLAGEPLHPSGQQQAMASTLSGDAVVTAPAQRRPERGIAPELDALCVSALAMSPAARPSARQLAERVEAYLDGDRDLVRRRAIASDELARAQAGLAVGRRAEAMQAAGRALALDPELGGAGELVTRLMLDPPTRPPPELQAAIEAADREGVKRHAVTAIMAYLAIASFLPIAMWNGIRNWPAVIAVFCAAILMAASAWVIRHRPPRGFGPMLLYALGNVILLALISRMAGPFTFLPALTCVVVMSVMAYPQFIQRPAVLIILMMAGFLVPISLEMQGVIPITWEIRDGSLISHAGALVVHGLPTVVMVLTASLATILIAGIHAAALAGASRTAQHQLVAQAWHLRQLLPAPGRT